MSTTAEALDRSLLPDILPAWDEEAVVEPTRGKPVTAAPRRVVGWDVNGMPRKDRRRGPVLAISAEVLFKALNEVNQAELDRLEGVQRLQRAAPGKDVQHERRKAYERSKKLLAEAKA
jgi:hypothetical protein